MATKAKTTQDFLPIDEIRDGVVVLKGGNLRMVLICSSLNFSLKSPDFPIQIFLNSRKLDIRPYIDILEKRQKEQTNELIKIQTKEYIQFIRSFTESVNVMAKSFFMVIPYDPMIIDTARGGWLGKIFPGGKKSGTQAKRDIFEENKTQLEQRVAVVEQGLARFGVRTAPLGTEELVELYFKIFNPGETAVPSLN